MQKVININFQGRILPIEEVAYEMLKQYIQTLRNYFDKEEGRDEIINDIECRIAELCDVELKKGTICITNEHINLIITSIGRPADFEAQDGFEASATTSNTGNANYTGSPSNESNTWEPAPNKRLYRDEQNKVLGGVCSGIANYFNVDPLVVRILWIFLIGINVLGYLILWIAVPSSSVKEVGGPRKRLFRDIDHKIIGGVCAGLSKYFGIQVWIIRILFLIPFANFIINFRHIHLFQFWDFPDFPNFLDLTFSPGAIFVYIVLWLVLPEAKTSADKLEMVGEKVDINSIKNTIQSDMEGFGKRAQTWGNDFYKKSKDNQDAGKGAFNSNGNAAENVQTENRPQVQRTGCLHFVSKSITILIKAFVYFVLGIIIFSILAALFGIGIVTTGLLPLRHFIIEKGLQDVLIWAALLLFIWVPVVGIVTAVIRKFAGIKKANVWVRSSLWALWVIGIVSFVFSVITISGNFSKHNDPIEENIALSNSKVNYLEVTATPKNKYYEDTWFKMEPFDYYDEDTLFVRNLRIRIIQSKTDSFEVKVVKLSNGKTVPQANQMAQNINFSLTQKDSLLFLDRGIAITKQGKFRNQHVIMTIAVPIGKRIKISRKGWEQVNVRVNRQGIHGETIGDLGFGHDSWDGEWYNRFDDESYSFERGVEYLMTTDGLEKIGRSTDDINDDKYDHDDNSDNIQQKLNDLKEERKRLEGDLERSRSEKLKEVEKIDRALEKKMEEKKEKSIPTNKTSVTVIENVSKAASKLGDLNWVMERFTY